MISIVRLLLLGCLLIRCQYTYAQTVYAGESTVDKGKVAGLYLTLQGDGKQIEKDWETQLQQYGRVSASRGTYRVSNASIPSVSSEPINLVSTVKSARTSATIFAAFDLGNGNYATTGGTGYAGAEELLKNFSANTLYQQEVRGAQADFDEAQKNHQKLVRNGERLQRAIEQNAKEKERLLKRIEDTDKDLIQLQTDTETNKTELEKALLDLESRKGRVEAVKAKKSN